MATFQVAIKNLDLENIHAKQCDAPTIQNPVPRLQQNYILMLVP